jgi:hypothetical protein
VGMYINPPQFMITKEEWLFNHAEEIRGDPPKEFINNSPFVWVCLVENPSFSAAAVAYDKQELLRFSNPADKRFKTWFQILKEDVKTVTPAFEHTYLE